MVGKKFNGRMTEVKGLIDGLQDVTKWAGYGGGPDSYDAERYLQNVYNGMRHSL
jgi:hypothetical protein